MSLPRVLNGLINICRLNKNRQTVFIMNKKRKLQCFFDRNDVYPWPWTFADEVLTKDIKKLAGGKNIPTIVEEFVDGHIYHYLNEQEANALINVFLKKLVNNEKYLSKVVYNIHSLVKKLLDYCEKIPNKNLDNISSNDLLVYVKEYEARLKKARMWGWIPPLVDGLTEPFLSEACISSLRKDLPGAGVEKINKIYSALSAADTLGEVQKSEIDKLKLVIRLGSKQIREFLSRKNTNLFIQSLPRAIRRSIDAYIRKYAWISYNYEGPRFTAEMLKSSLKGVTIGQARKELSRIFANHRGAIMQKKSLMRTHRLSRQTKHLLRVASIFMALKEYRKSVYQQSYLLIDPVMEQLAKRIGVRMDEVKFIPVSELKVAMQDRQKYKKIARYRRKYCAVIINNGQSRYFHGEKAARLVNQYRAPQKKESVKTLNGLIAYPGKAAGTARIILTPKDMAKMNANDILISSSTNPDLLSAMKKAAAFVTDLGGIICHAAIISRELRTPCIVGTRLATKVIKDGDRVEVDADKGIVRIL